MSKIAYPLHDDEQLLCKTHSKRPAYTAADVLLYLIPGDILILLVFYVAFEMNFPVEIPAETLAFLSQPMVLVMLFVFGMTLPLVPILHAWARTKKHYLFTNQRALVYNTHTKEVELEVPLATLSEMKLTEHGKGLVSLRLWQHQHHADGANFYTRTGFEYIPAELLQKLLVK